MARVFLGVVSHIH